MSNCRRWSSVFLSVVILFLVLISSMEKSQSHMVYKAVSPPESQVASQSGHLFQELSINRIYIKKQEQKQAESVEELKNEEIGEHKKTVRMLAAQKKRKEHYLLASRSMHLMKYAQYEKMERGKQVAKNAEHLLGSPYQWGGTNPRGFDCSGFTQYVYAQYGGVKVPRNSYDQYNQGKPVSREQLQPGDLVFFTTYAPGPSHLGIYIGDGKFVHALNQETGVTISKLDADYYKQRFLGARRVL